MTGITILETWTERAKSLGEVIGISLFALAISVTCIITLIYVIRNLHKSEFRKFAPHIICKYLSVIGIAVLLIWFAWKLTANIQQYNTVYTYHTVTIDDSASFQKVNEKYEFVKEDFDVYTLKERGD